MTPRVLDLRIKSFFSIWGVLYVAPWLIVLLSVFAICNFSVAQKTPMQRPDGQIEPTYKSQPLSHWSDATLPDPEFDGKKLSVWLTEASFGIERMHVIPPSA